MTYKKFNPELYAGLNNSQKSVLFYLDKATRIIDSIFTKQIKSDNYGYPEKITKNRVLQLSKKNPKLLSHYTVVKLKNKNLEIMRYEKYYENELLKIADNLIKAAKKCSDVEFKNFLYQRARDLLEGSYVEGEELWVKLKTRYPINLAIGPLLTYHDKLFSIKTYYSSCVYLRNINKEKLYQKMTDKLKKHFLASTFVKTDIASKKEIIEVGDIYCYSGEVAKMKAVAWSRPSTNTECREVLKKFGSRKLLFENAVKARFVEDGFRIYQKLFENNINKQDLVLYTLMAVYLHELGHGFANYKGSENRMLDYYWKLEELKSDLFSFRISPWLMKYKFISSRKYRILINGLITDIISQYKLAQRVPERKSHAFSILYLLVRFTENDIVEIKGNRLYPDYQKFDSISGKLLKEIQTVLAEFSYGQTDKFIKSVEKKALSSGIINLLADL